MCWSLYIFPRFRWVEWCLFFNHRQCGKSMCRAMCIEFLQVLLHACIKSLFQNLFHLLLMLSLHQISLDSVDMHPHHENKIDHVNKYDQGYCQITEHPQLIDIENTRAIWNNKPCHSVNDQHVQEFISKFHVVKTIFDVRSELQYVCQVCSLDQQNTSKALVLRCKKMCEEE